MVIERKKRTAMREERQRNVKTKGALPPMECVIVTSMEPFSQRLPPIDIALLTEYVTNYDPEDGSSVVHGRIIGINEVTLNKVLYLLMGELPVSGDLESDFVPSKYLKSKNKAFEKNQGWKTTDALMSELGEWMWFVQKRLGLNRYSTNCDAGGDGLQLGIVCCDQTPCGIGREKKNREGYHDVMLQLRV
uniref:Predicted protein n=1 Tax=Physcomitrium patens TaxID=3218 RepID=A9U6J7_PHYPA